MLTRIITAIVGFAIILPVLMFSDTVALNILIALLSVASVYEFLNCTGYIKNKAVSISSFVFALLIPFAARTASCFDSYIKSSVNVCVSIVIIYVIICFALSVFSKGKNDIVTSSFVTLFGVYIVCGLSSIIIIRDMNGGEFFYPLIFVAAWATDIFAYFVGVFFGKHKLIPDVSPKKTIEGAIGGILGNMGCFALYGALFLELEPAQYVFLIAMAPVASVISQIGDLLMSLVKRRFSIKDFGKILPGHGGILDRFDSTIAVSLFLCITCGIMGLLN